MKVKGFAIAMKEYFGLHPNQTMMQFAGELNQLSHDEKMEFWQLLFNAGVVCEQPAQKNT